MLDELRELFQIDWRIFMSATTTWLDGGNPYGKLSAEFSAGAFAYPPTTLAWMALFVPLGPFGFYIWTALYLAGWWLMARKEHPTHALLLIWSPVVLHVVEGQSTLPMVLILWAALRAPKRGWLWGLAIAFTLTKPQTALFPVLWMLWLDRGAPWRWRLLGGIVLGTLLLALPATLRNPLIWQEWIISLSSYRERIFQAAAWQGPSIVLLALAAYLWYRSRLGGWHWWATAGLFPHTSFYDTVVLLPMLQPSRNYWTLAGLGIAGVLQGPSSELILPWILAGHMLAAWMLTRPIPLPETNVGGFRGGQSTP